MTAKRGRYQAVYSPDLSTGYIQVPNGTLFRLNVSRQDVAVSSVWRDLETLESPPANSTLVAGQNNSLFAVFGAHGCGSSSIEIQQYNAQKKGWDQIAESSEKWYNDDSTIWYDRTNDNIYIYGGVCNGEITNKFYSFSVNSGKFATTTATPMPREMAYAGVISLDGSSSLVLGGKASTGWISMQQLAFWEFGSWTYRTIGGSDGIDSRDSPLLLPLWAPSGKDSSNAVIEKVLVVGGTVDGRAARPAAVVLDFNSTGGWVWKEMNKDIIPSDDELLATVYESLLVFGSDSTAESYDSNAAFAAVSSVRVPSSTASGAAGNNKGKMPTASIAAIGTIIPLVLIALGAVAAWVWWRKRQQRIVFQPRKSQIMSPSMLSFSGYQNQWDQQPALDRGFYTLGDESAQTLHGQEMAKDSQEPLQNPFDEKVARHSQDGQEMDHSDVQILVHKRRHALRVINPDTPTFSEDEDEVGDEVEASGHLYEDGTRSTKSRHRRNQSSISRLTNSSRTTSSRNVSRDEFDFAP